jgi:hypothetical protein
MGTYLPPPLPGDSAGFLSANGDEGAADLLDGAVMHTGYGLTSHFLTLGGKGPKRPPRGPTVPLHPHPPTRRLGDPCDRCCDRCRLTARRLRIADRGAVGTTIWTTVVTEPRLVSHFLDGRTVADGACCDTSYWWWTCYDLAYFRTFPESELFKRYPFRGSWIGGAGAIRIKAQVWVWSCEAGRWVILPLFESNAITCWYAGGWYCF